MVSTSTFAQRAQPKVLGGCWMLVALLLVDTMGGLLSELTVRPYYKLEKFIAAKQIPAVHTIKDRQALDVADASPSAFNHGTWDALLRAYVKPDRTFGEVTGATGVDYAGLSADARFDEYRASLAAADVEALPAPDQLALWMNAYNALCIGQLADAQTMHAWTAGSAHLARSIACSISLSDTARPPTVPAGRSHTGTPFFGSAFFVPRSLMLAVGVPAPRARMSSTRSPMQSALYAFIHSASWSGAGSASTSAAASDARYSSKRASALSPA